MKHERINELYGQADIFLNSQNLLMNDIGIALRECLGEIKKLQSHSKVLVIRKRLEACLGDCCPIRGEEDNKCPIFVNQQVNKYTTPCYKYPDCLKRRIAYCEGEI